jgi:predicted ATPase
LAKLEAVLAQGTNDLREVVPLLADLLSIPTGDRYPALNLTPQKRKEKTLHAQIARVEGLAARQPVLMAFEDVHWSEKHEADAQPQYEGARGEVTSTSSSCATSSS